MRWTLVMAALATAVGLFARLTPCRGESTAGLSNVLLKLTNDPYCGPSNVVVHKPAVQAPSTRRMVERLAQLSSKADPFKNQFLSDRIADAIGAQIPLTTNVPQRLVLLHRHGLELLNAGRTEAALGEFKAMEELATSVGMTMDARHRSEFRMRKGIALFRLAEQQNCVMDHNSESCLFPIQPAGYHRITQGSRAALSLYSEELKEFPNDLAARWLLNIASMTLGEYPDKTPAAWVIPPETFKSEYNLPKFPDVAGALGLDTEDIAGGCILDDFDNDGFIDIVTSSWALNGQLRYFHNDGDGHFTERTAEAGLLGIVGGLNIQQTDYNNDGLLDIWVLRGGWMGSQGRMPKSLLRNNGDGTFTDVTEEAGLLSPHPSQTSAWFDYDGDGWLDVFIGNETTDPREPEPCELYHNNHDGTFTECANLAGIRVNRFVKGVACGDYDNDGRPDLYLSCKDGPGFLFHNDGPAGGSNVWQFSESSKKAGVGLPVHSFPTWFFDYDNDGYEDLYVSGYQIDDVGDVAADYLGLPHHGQLPKLYRNNHDGTFADVTAEVHLNRICHAMGCNYGDLDNDGWLDFYLGTGDPNLKTLIPKRMFRNAGGKYFQDVTTAGGFGHLQKGHGIAFADVDNDGDQDVFIVLGGAYPGDIYRKVLFLNPGNANHWIKLKLEGTRCNRAAIGARIDVNVETPSGARHIYKTVSSGASFGSSPLRQEIGLGDAARIQSIEIFWPASGLKQSFAGLELDKAYHIREGENTPSLIDLKPLHFNLAATPAPNHKMQIPGL